MAEDPRGAVAMLLTIQATGAVLNLATSIDSATCFIETKALDMGEVHFTKLLDQIVSHISNRADQDNMLLAIFGSDDEDGPFILVDTIALPQVDPGNIRPPAHKYFKLRYIDNGILQRWHLHGFTIFGEIGGEEF